MLKRIVSNTSISISIALLLSACGGDGTPMGTNKGDANSTSLSAPTLTLKGDSNIDLIAGDTYTELGTTSNASVAINSDLNTSKAGIYTITYVATNDTGAKTTLTRTVTVKTPTSLNSVAPIDSNIELGGDSSTLFYVDPRPEENGFNRALRINYDTMTFDQLHVDGVNPHSIDRAGETNRFYIRTQNSYSFDVINFDTQEVKTVSLGDHKPRAIGGYNKKYNLQLLSAKDMPVVDVIDVDTDSVIATLGDRHTYNKADLTSNAGSGSATGHSFWLTDDYFALIDRVHSDIRVFKVNADGKSFSQTSVLHAGTAFHAIERVVHPQTKEDLTTFYGYGEGDLTRNIVPYIMKLSFDTKTGILSRAKKANGEDAIAWLSRSNQKVNNVNPTTHHGGITPDGKYFVAPVLDGKVYFIDRKTMQIAKVLDAELGAAHIEFSAPLNLAIVTNHFDHRLTIIDLKTLTVKRQLTISDHRFDPNNKHLLQPHFSYLSKDGRYFYTFATQDGDFLKIDLETMQIVDRLHTGGAPEQAHS